MATITLKNIPERVYEQLKLTAQASHRSVNSEIIHRLEKSLGVLDPESVRRQLEEFRTRIAKKGGITEEEITRLKNEGRP